MAEFIVFSTYRSITPEVFESVRCQLGIAVFWSRVKLPDAIILATAQSAASILVTRNTRDFPVGPPGIRVPYKLLVSNYPVKTHRLEAVSFQRLCWILDGRWSIARTRTRFGT